MAVLLAVNLDAWAPSASLSRLAPDRPRLLSQWHFFPAVVFFFPLNLHLRERCLCEGTAALPVHLFVASTAPFAFLAFLPYGSWAVALVVLRRHREWFVSCVRCGAA